jgi:hypothetical protein
MALRGPEEPEDSLAIPAAPSERPTQTATSGFLRPIWRHPYNGLRGVASIALSTPTTRCSSVRPRPKP